LNSQLEDTRQPRHEWALASYIAAIRAHRGAVVLVTLVTVAASIAFLQLRSASYEATADLLVQPLPQDDETFRGLPLVRDTGDPTRTVQTAAALVESQAGQDVGGAVQVNPKGESNILEVTATADSAGDAARIANAYAQEALQARAEELDRHGTQLITQLEARLDATPRADPVTRAEIASRLDQVRSVTASGDPTLTLSQEAAPPTSAEGASAALIVVLATLAGFTLGVGTAVLLDLSERRLRDGDEALAVYPLPTLLRVPRLPARRLERPPGSVWHMPPEVREPFRTLAVQLDERGGESVLMVTSPSAGDGKTTSAVNLAVSLAETGKRVVLLDFDLRKPDVRGALGLEHGAGFIELGEQNDHLERLLQTVSDVWSMRVLAIRGEVENPGLIPGLVDLLGQRLSELVAEARTLADYVVIDTAPLGEVGDALRLVRDVDDIVLLVRPGNTNRVQLEMVRDLLEQIGERPLGFIILGVDGLAHSTYGYGHARQQASEAMRRLVRPEPHPTGAPDRPSTASRTAKAQGARASEGAAGPGAARDPARPGRRAQRG
jgi:capsular exopolysaccharide synthesis family protein